MRSFIRILRAALEALRVSLWSARHAMHQQYFGLPRALKRVSKSSQRAGVTGFPSSLGSTLPCVMAMSLLAAVGGVRACYDPCGQFAVRGAGAVPPRVACARD